MLEDDFNDILRKAAHGLSLDSEALAAKTTLAPTRIEAVRKGKTDDTAVIVSVATALGLDPERVLRVSRNDYRPVASLPDGVIQITTDYSFMRVHAYVLYDPTSRDAVIIDSGASADPIIEVIEANQLRPTRLLLTHKHPDHIAGIKGLVTRFPSLPVSSPQGENYERGESFPAGATFTVGALKIRSVQTRGHTPAGVTFLCNNLAKPLAFCGDAIFAGSIGGPRIDYRQCLSDVKENLLSLDDETIIAPGHGPLSTVGQELTNNPFFTTEAPR